MLYTNSNPSPSLDTQVPGQLTARQRSSIEPTSAMAGVVVLLVAGVTSIMLSFALFSFAWENLDANTGSFPSGILMALLALGFLTLIGIVMWFASRPLVQRQLLIQDLAEGRVAQDAGQVIFSRRGYVAIVAGRSLRARDGRKNVKPVPGDYSFSYLPRSRRLLSAEYLPGQQSGYPNAAFLSVLAKANHFSMNDLHINAQGRLSRRQSWWLARSFSLAMLALIVGAVFAFWPTNPLHLAGVWSVSLVLGLLALIAYISFKRLQDLLSGRVNVLEGMVTTDTASDREDTTYYYIINGKRFSVSQLAYRALVPGLRYHVYCTPYSGILISIEPLA